MGGPVIFGILAAIGWGTGPIASKKAFDNGGNPIAATILQTIIGVIILSTITIITSPNSIKTQILHTTIWPFILSGIVGTAIGRYLLYYSIDNIGASVTSAVAATDPLFATTIAFLFLSESFSFAEGIGVVIAVTGIVLLSQSKGGNKEGWKSKLIILPTIGAVAYGTGAAIRRFGFTSETISPIYAAAINEITALTIFLLGVAITRTSITKTITATNYKYLLLTGCLYTGGTVSMFAALNAGPVIIGTTLGSLATVVTVIGTAIFLRQIEMITIRTIIGATISVIGTLMLILTA